MTDHAARLYALVVAVLVFFLAWAVVAARPWASASAKADPKLAALTLREQRVRAKALAVQKVVDRRWAAYRAALAERKRAIAAVKAADARAATLAAASSRTAGAAAPSPSPTSAPAPGAAPSPAPVPAPSVRVVTLPPVTVTRSS